jgi:hypothetical protein
VVDLNADNQLRQYLSYRNIGYSWKVVQHNPGTIRQNTGNEAIYVLLPVIPLVRLIVNDTVNIVVSERSAAAPKPARFAAKDYEESISRLRQLER